MKNGLSRRESMRRVRRGCRGSKEADEDPRGLRTKITDLLYIREHWVGAFVRGAECVSSVPKELERVSERSGSKKQRKMAGILVK